MLFWVLHITLQELNTKIQNLIGTIITVANNNIHFHLNIQQIHENKKTGNYLLSKTHTLSD